MWILKAEEFELGHLEVSGRIRVIRKTDKMED